MEKNGRSESAVRNNELRPFTTFRFKFLLDEVKIIEKVLAIATAYKFWPFLPLQGRKYKYIKNL